MRKTILATLSALILAGGLYALPATAETKTVDSIAAVVNDEPITSRDVDREYALVLKEVEKSPPADLIGLRSVALNRLVDKKLIEQKIRDLGIKVSDEELKQSIEDVKKQNGLTQEQLVAALNAQGMSFEQYRNQLKEQLERLRLMSQEVRSKIQVGEKEMRQYYDDNAARFGADETFRARHIFLKADAKAGAAEVAAAQAKAGQALAEAKAGKDFVELAKTYSSDPAAAKDGGDLGTFHKSDMQPEIAETVSKMKPGEVSPVVRSAAGFHVIKLEERSKGKGKTFEEVKAEIEDALYRKKSEERFAQWVKELRSSASIEIR